MKRTPCGILESHTCRIYPLYYRGGHLGPPTHPHPPTHPLRAFFFSRFFSRTLASSVSYSVLRSPRRTQSRGPSCRERFEQLSASRRRVARKTKKSSRV